MHQSEINSLNNFIAGWFIDEALSDSLLREFHLNEKHHIDVSKEYYGYTALTNALYYLNFTTRDLYLQALDKVAKKYFSLYKFSDEKKNYFNIDYQLNIQHYKPNNYYSEWHCENSGYLPHVNRHLAFMTYLNTVEEGGETEFYYQKLKVKPKKGLTLIWPTSWPFTHKGLPAPNEEKYIVTGWFIFTGWRGVEVER